MANPPPASLQDRLLRTVQTLQFGWFCGHLTMIFFTLRYALYWITFKGSSKWALMSYRVAFFSTLATYCIVVYKGYRARVRQGKPTGALSLLTDENVQYLLMALTWFLSRLTPLALLPFVVYSVFHVLTYVRGNLIPIISPPPASAPSATSPPSGRPAQPPRPTGPVADAIGKFIKEYYDSSMTLVAFLEIALWFRVAFSALLFARGSWILLVAYSVFLRARYAQSSFVQSAFANLAARADAVLANQSTDPRVRAVWEQVKSTLRSVVDSTDVQRMAAARAQAEQAKKAQ